VTVQNVAAQFLTKTENRSFFRRMFTCMCAADNPKQGPGAAPFISGICLILFTSRHIDSIIGEHGFDLFKLWTRA